MTNKFLLAALLVVVTQTTVAEETIRSCQGNIETFDRKIEKAGVSYKLWYELLLQATRPKEIY